LDGLAPGDLENAIEERRTLAQAWSVRAAPHLFPAADLDIFTLGLLPWDETSLRHFVRGVSDHLDKAGMSAPRLLELTSELVGQALKGRALVKEDLGIEVARLMEPMLLPEQAARWHEKDLFGHFGETMVRYALYLSSLQGRVMFGRREGSRALLVRPDEWLRAPSYRATPEEARAELVRRYLRCYGPSSPSDLAAWAGICPDQAAAMWALVRDELTDVDLAGRAASILSSDVAAYDSPSKAEGVRLVPPHDPYLQMRDRSLLVPDVTRHASIWKATGNPGAILHEGEVIGTWRPRKKGREMGFEVELFTHPRGIEAGIAEEAGAVAGLRNARLGRLYIEG
jgi:hypothetical protein